MNRAWSQLAPLQKIAAARRAGVPRTVVRLREKVWSTSTSLGLRAPLDDLPSPRRAKVPMEMSPVDSARFDGFRDELESGPDDEVLEMLARQRMCDAGVETLYVATVEGGRRIYAQWCIDPQQQRVLNAISPGYYVTLASGEVLLEGAYTFPNFRGVGAMSDGMGQLVRAAHSRGAHAAITYVNITNVPSLRGCAAVGFRADHMRTDVWRMGRRRSRLLPLSRDAQQAFGHATAPRSK